MTTQQFKQPDSRESFRALFCATFAFTTCFAVWTIFSIIGLKIKSEIGLNDTQFGVLIATPILTGSLSRLILGVWADQYGGRLVFTLLMIVTALSTWLLTYANSYLMFLLAALGIGLAGGGFAVGITYVSKWYSQERQGMALGIFGVGNVGAAITSFSAPLLLITMGGRWQEVVGIYAVILFVVAVIFWLTTKDDPALVARKNNHKKPISILDQLQPLKNPQVWRFSFYYFFVFGGYVALALWLPRYYMGSYGLEIHVAGMLAALYAIPGSLFRALGGWLSDKFGARKIMYWTFTVCFICTFIMSYPSTEYIVKGIDGPIRFDITIPLYAFVLLTIILGFFMSLGKAAVYKHIPIYYPNYVGSVGGAVGLIGGLGGFILPIIFGAMNDLIGIWTSCFMLLTVIICCIFTWMHFSILRLNRDENPALKQARDLPLLDQKESAS